MVAETKTFSVKEGRAIVDRFTSLFRCSIEDYLNKIASCSYLIVKDGKNGVRVAIHRDNMPQTFSSIVMAENEMINEENDEFKYTGFSVMNELEYWKLIGVAE